MQGITALTTIVSHDKRFLPITIKNRHTHNIIPLTPDCKPVQFEYIIEGDEGIKVEAMTNDVGNPIISINRINRKGEIIYPDGTYGSIVCYHYNQNIVCEQHRFGLFDYDVEVEAAFSGLNIKISRIVTDIYTTQFVENWKLHWDN